MKKKIQFEDEAWEELEDFYQDDLELHDEKYVSEVEEELDNSLKDVLYYGEGDPAEFVQNIEFDMTNAEGVTYHVELVGRLDMENGTYLMVHPVGAPDPALLWIVKAWDDAEGNLQVAAIEDSDEYDEVLKFAEQTLYDDPDAQTIEGGGVQQDD